MTQNEKASAAYGGGWRAHGQPGAELPLAETAHRLGQPTLRAMDGGRRKRGRRRGLLPGRIRGDVSTLGRRHHPFQPCAWALADTEVEDRIDAIRRQEAEDIAGLLRQIVNQQWQTLDREATEATGREAYRPVEYSDICVLMPSRTGLQILERGIEGQDIPYRLESASLIFETQEIRDLLNCLKAIDDPGNQVATVAALRSPAFGCSDVDLLCHYEGGGRFDYLQMPAERRDGPVTEALDTLQEFHQARVWDSAGALIDRFVRERS